MWMIALVGENEIPLMITTVYSNELWDARNYIM